MPITDAQARAGLDEFKRRWPQVSPSLDLIRAVLEAADRAAWSTDMEAAPRDQLLIVETDSAHGLSPFVTVCKWHPDAGFCVDELRDVIRWRPLPALPKSAEQEAGDVE